MPYYSRVLSKDEAFPAFEELAELIRAQHPDFRLSIESGDEEEWESLLLSSVDEVEVAVVERNPVFDGSTGQDEIADFLEDIQDCKPQSGVQWLAEYLEEVKTVYAFQHLQGSEMEEGGNALHALRSALWERGDAIIQATAKVSPTKKDSTSYGSSPTRFQARGIWACFKTPPGTISRWIWATRTTGKPS